MPSLKDRRRAQAGTTLVELLVSLVIIGLALVLVVGTLSTGLLDATLAKRNVAAQAVTQYEMDKIGTNGFSNSPENYSDCFATGQPTSPALVAYQGACPGGAYALRADVSWQWLPSRSGVQVWTVTVMSVASSSQVGSAVSVYKVTYQ